MENEYFARAAKTARDWFYFTGSPNPDKRENIWLIADEAPEWVSEMAHEAHGGISPDDWCYEFIVAALDYLAETGDADLDDWTTSGAAEPDISTSELCRWLSSHGWRPEYVDDAIRDFGMKRGGGIIEDIQAGQRVEREDIAGRVSRWLVENMAEMGALCELE